MDIGPVTNWKQIAMERVQNWTPGTRLIFTRDGGGLSFRLGYVYTFANWFTKSPPEYPTDEPGHWVQFKEIHDQGNHLHNANAHDLEIYDPEKHPDALLVTQDILTHELRQFIETYGG